MKDKQRFTGLVHEDGIMEPTGYSGVIGKIDAMGWVQDGNYDPVPVLEYMLEQYRQVALQETLKALEYVKEVYGESYVDEDIKKVRRMAKVHQSCLLRMNIQPVFPKPLRQYIQHSFCIVEPLEDHHRSSARGNRTPRPSRNRT